MVDKAANQQVTLSVGEIKWCELPMSSVSSDTVDCGRRRREKSVECLFFFLFGFAFVVVSGESSFTWLRLWRRRRNRKLGATCHILQG